MTATEQKLVRVRRAEKMVTHLQRLDLYYLLGGARRGGQIVGPRSRGAEWSDCSGFAIYLLRVAGVDLRHPDGWTGTLQHEGEPGTSEYLTLYLKEPDLPQGHVIVRLRKRPKPWHAGVPHYRWAECGGYDNPSPRGGPHWLRPSPDRIAEFTIQRRFAAL